MILIRPTTPVHDRLEMYRGIAIAFADSPLVESVANRARHRHAHLAALGVAEPLAASILREVQSMRLYRPDDPGPDQLWAPNEVLGDRGGGDCEDLAVLVASVARACGVRFVIEWLNRRETGNPQSHVTVLLSPDNGETYQYAEACIDDAAFGEHPLEAAARVKSTMRERIEGR